MNMFYERKARKSRKHHLVEGGLTAIVSALTRLSETCVTASTPDVQEEMVHQLATALAGNDSRFREACILATAGGAQAHVPVNVLLWVAKSGTAAVRAAVLQVLSHLLTTKAIPADSKITSLALQFLDDDSERVRMGAIHLVWLLSMLQLESRQQGNNNAAKRNHVNPIDPSFIALCGALGDACASIRAKACLYIGTFNAMSTELALQLLRKEPVTRRIPANGPKQKAIVEPITRSYPQLLRDPATCGAFVHGMEDEFEAVRNNAVDALTTLSMHRVELAKVAISFFVDMFNDEAESVRLNAITSFHTLAQTQPITLSMENVKTMAMVFQDGCADVRAAAHRFIGAVRAATPTVAKQILDVLSAGIRRFPEDKLSIYACLQGFGRMNTDIVDAQLGAILKLDKRFLPKQPDIEDIEYIGRLICVLNADKDQSLKFPRFVYQHALYLQGKYPQFLPCETDSLRVHKSFSVREWAPDAAWTATEAHITEAWKTWHTHHPGADAALEAGRIASNLHRLALPSSDPNARAHFLSAYMRCGQWFAQIKTQIRTLHNRPTTRHSATRLLGLSRALPHAYHGLTTELKAALAVVEVFAMAAGVLVGEDDGWARAIWLVARRAEEAERLTSRVPHAPTNPSLNRLIDAFQVSSNVTAGNGVPRVKAEAMLEFVQTLRFPTPPTPRILRRV